VFPASREHWLPVLDSLRQASRPLISWRQKRNLTDGIMIVRGEDEQLALEIYDAVDDEKLKKKITKLWAIHERHLPRNFTGPPTHNKISKDRSSGPCVTSA
jgi:hypothetical protein